MRVRADDVDIATGTYPCGYEPGGRCTCAAGPWPGGRYIGCDMGVSTGLKSHVDERSTTANR